jgi:PhzF family phenazine biosynthesis protein
VNVEDIININPDFTQLAKVDARGVIVSARGKEVDFVSRFFGPQVGINEDPVTGSAHTTLTPYWSRQLVKQEMIAKQLSERGGDLSVKMRGNRVEISGNAITYLEGEITIPD